MSRIYDALKRAAEQARSREALVKPQLEEEPTAASLDARCSAVRGEGAAAAAIQAPAPAEPLPELIRDPPRPQPVGRTGPTEVSAPKGLKSYREQVREILRVRLALEREQQAQEGRHLFEGNWLTANQIRRLRQRLTRRALGILIQLLLLFLVMGFTSLALLWLLRLALPA